MRLFRSFRDDRALLRKSAAFASVLLSAPGDAERGRLAAVGAPLAGQGPGAAVPPPLVVGPATGPLRALDYALPMASAQVKTAILLAGLYADGETAVTEPGPSRDHERAEGGRSERLLDARAASHGRRRDRDRQGDDGECD